MFSGVVLVNAIGVASILALLVVALSADIACRKVSSEVEASPILCGILRLLLTISSKFLLFSDSSELVLSFVLVLLRLLFRRCRRKSFWASFSNADFNPSFQYPFPACAKRNC